MRITNTMMTNIMMANLHNNLSNMTKLQKQNSDGKRIHKPSDDPVGITKLMSYKTELSEISQYEKNISSALSWYQVSETSLVDINSAVGRMRDLAVQAANNATNTKEEQQKLKSEIEELKKHLIAAGNFNYAGRFIFSGHQDHKKLLKKDGTYNIEITQKDLENPQKIKTLISQTESMDLTIHGSELFGIVEDLGAYGKMLNDTAGSNFKQGITAIQGKFDLSKDYQSDTLGVSINGTNYNVDVTGLDGREKPITKTLLIERYRTAPSALGTDKLGDVADIYFDKNDNFVIAMKNQAATINNLSSKFVSSTIEQGVRALKSELKGKFAISGPNSDYRGKNLNVTIGGSEYTVDTSEITGAGIKLTKDFVLEKFRDAKNAANESLFKKADVFFDEEDNLVIKEREYGAKSIQIATNTAGYSPTLSQGSDEKEASVDYAAFPLTDAHIAANEEEIKSTPIFVSHNSVRRKIELDKNAVVDTVDKYVAELKKQLDKSFGANKINVDTSGGYLKLSTINTPKGELPQISVSPVISKKSSLIRDVDKYIKALDEGDQKGVNDFLKNIDIHINRTLSVRADLGAKYNRMELSVSRNKDNELAYTEALNNVANVDLSQSIMQLKNYDNVYKASLSTGAKIIQPSLLDFIK